MSILSHLPHTVDHYERSIAKGRITRDSSAGAVYTTAAQPTNADIRCFVQPVSAEVTATYKQRNMSLTKSIFMTDGTAYEAVGVDDVLVFEGHSFVVKGKAKLCELNRVFRIDVNDEQGGR